MSKCMLTLKFFGAVRKSSYFTSLQKFSLRTRGNFSLGVNIGSETNTHVICKVLWWTLHVWPSKYSNISTSLHTVVHNRSHPPHPPPLPKYTCTFSLSVTPHVHTCTLSQSEFEACHPLALWHFCAAESPHKRFVSLPGGLCPFACKI